MNKVSQATVKQLLELEDNATVSIYLPTHRFPTSEHIGEDKIRFKNLIRAGKEMLEASGVDDGIIHQLCTELDTTVYDNDDFWQHTTEGLAVFCSPANVQYFHLPIECEEYVSVGDKYDITPLLLAVSYDHPYYLLALATHRPVLFRGDMYGVERVDLELPESPEVALNIDELYSNSQTARAGGFGAGNPGVKSHGQGDSRQAGQEERLKFFRMIDEKILSSGEVDNSSHFVLAGADDDMSSFQELSRIKHITESRLSGNYTEMSPAEIHGRSWPLVYEEIGKKTRMNEIEKLGNLLGTGKSSTEIGDITRAASDGRIDVLLLAALLTTRDTVSDGEDEVVKLVFPHNYEKDTITDIARAVFDQGGEVIGVFEGDIPDGSSQAARYRY